MKYLIVAVLHRYRTYSKSGIFLRYQSYFDSQCSLPFEKYLFLFFCLLERLEGVGFVIRKPFVTKALCLATPKIDEGVV